MFLSYRREQAGRGHATLPDHRTITLGERLQAILIITFYVRNGQERYRAVTLHSLHSLYSQHRTRRCVPSSIIGGG